MNTASCKQKGRVLQQFVRDSILETFPELTERDCLSNPMGCPGEDIILSEKASQLFPYSVECANQESLQIWAKLKQAEGQNRKLTPLLVFKRNHTEVYCALKYKDFIELIKKVKNV